MKLMPVFSLMPMLEPPFSATRYASCFLFMLVLLLVFVTSFLAAYALMSYFRGGDEALCLQQRWQALREQYRVEKTKITWH